MFPQAQKQTLTSVTKQIDMDYLLTLPLGYDEELERRWPLLLTLHGSVGSDDIPIEEMAIDLDIVRVKEVVPEMELPFVIVSPRCPRGYNGWWEPFLLHALLDEIEAHYRIDVEREYVTGFSMGGGATWKVAVSRPLRFAALAPLASWGTPFEAAWLSHIPAWIFHGALDEGIPVREAEAMAEALRKHGGDVQLTIYPDLGHPILAQTYSNPELYRWLLGQKRMQT